MTFQAELLDRLGYPAWEWESPALLRAVNWLHDTVFDVVKLIMQLVTIAGSHG